MCRNPFLRGFSHGGTSSPSPREPWKWFIRSIAIVSHLRHLHSHTWSDAFSRLFTVNYRRLLHAWCDAYTDTALLCRVKPMFPRLIGPVFYATLPSRDLGPPQHSECFPQTRKRVSRRFIQNGKLVMSRLRRSQCVTLTKILQLLRSFYYLIIYPPLVPHYRHVNAPVHSNGSTMIAVPPTSSTSATKRSRGCIWI